MMNLIWVGMMAAGILFAAVNGTLSEYSAGLLTASENAVTFVIGLAGIMAVWSGMMNVARETGLIQALARRSAWFMDLLFPGVKRQETISMMLMAFLANLFGAGNSATVFSIKAMSLLDEENHHRSRASHAMCMFAAVNMAMIQLVPITVIQVRRQAGSLHPEDIILPSILAGLLATLASILVCRFFARREGR